MMQLFAILIPLVLAQPNPGPRSEEQANFLFQEASEAQKNGKTELAVQDYEKILKTYPQFREKFTVYQQLMDIYLAKKNYSAVLDLGKKALLQHPPRETYFVIQLLRAEAQLQSGKADQTKIILDELLKKKPDTAIQTAALLYKAEAFSQLGKHKEAFASLDAAKNNVKHADAELKIRARACSAQQRKPKEESMDYFHEKNLCFKESAALAKSEPTKDSVQVWCDRFQGLESELKKAKLDEFTREKLEKELRETSALTTSWGCG